MFQSLSAAEGWIGLLTLTLMEIVLGIDNIVFISILVGRLPEQSRTQARITGLSLAVLIRILLLFGVTWLIGLSSPLLAIGGISMTGRDLIFFAGGLFLMAKSTSEIHAKIEGSNNDGKTGSFLNFKWVIIQIIFLDIIFSFDSILTAIGLSRDIPVMILAVLISLGVMLIFSGAISAFINKYPTVKMLALAFLLMIGLLLVVEAFHVDVPKGYVYFAMAFSLFVEVLNLRIRHKS